MVKVSVRTNTKLAGQLLAGSGRTLCPFSYKVKKIYGLRFVLTRFKTGTKMPRT